MPPVHTLLTLNLSECVILAVIVAFSLMLCMCICKSKVIGFIKFVMTGVVIAFTLSLTITAFNDGCSHYNDGPKIIELLVKLNISTLALFWIDKFCAMIGCLRIPELALHYMTFFGSPVGALIGIYCPS